MQAAEKGGFAKSHTLPDGNIGTIGNERFRGPEVLFNPGLMGKEAQGIDVTVFDSVQKCDVDIRKDLLENVVMSCATTMFEGIVERMTRELTALAPQSMQIESHRSARR